MSSGELCTDCGGYTAPDVGVHTSTCSGLALRADLNRVSVGDLRRYRAAGVDVAPVYLRDRGNVFWYGRLGFEALHRASGLFYLPSKHTTPESFFTTVFAALGPRADDMGGALDFAAATPPELHSRMLADTIDTWLERVSKTVRHFNGGPKVEHYLRETRQWVAAQYGRQHARTAHYG